MAIPGKSCSQGPDDILGTHSQAQGQGRVFTGDGCLVASYSVQAMNRGFDQLPAFIGKDHRTAM